MNDKIDALAKAIWQRESPSAIYKALCTVLEPKVVPDDPAHPHIIGGEFQSDKYPTTPRGKVPLSVKDKTAQDILWLYAQRRREVDAQFADDLEWCLKVAGYKPAYDTDMVEVRATDFFPFWAKYPYLALATEIGTSGSVNIRAEIRDLLREARADAVRFIKDANEGEIQKARNEGVEDERARRESEVPSKPTYVTPEGLVLLPDRVRVAMGIPEGGGVAFVDRGNGIVEMMSDETFLSRVPDCDCDPSFPHHCASTVEKGVADLQVRCENLQRELDADTGIIRSHIALREKAERELEHAKLIVACAWRVHHSGYIEDAQQELYRTLVRYAPEGDLPPQREMRVSRPCSCGHSKASHFSMEMYCLCNGCDCPRFHPAQDESVVTEETVDAIEEALVPEVPMNRYRITVLSTAGKDEKDPLFASRGRVFYVHGETSDKAAERFCENGIPAKDMVPAAKVSPRDFTIQPATNADIPEKAIENWTKARPG